MSFRAVLAVALLSSGCICVTGNPQEDAGVEEECVGTPLQQCKDWRCGGATLTSRTPAAGSTALTGDLSGHAVTDNIFNIDFTVTANANGSTTAVYKTSDFPCEDLVITLVDADNASFTWRGVTFTGRGELSAEQRAMLATFKNSPYVQAVVGVPLELGCHPDLSEAQVASLLFPFQVLLKYDASPNTRAAGLEALGQRSKCEYFEGRRDLSISATVDGEAKLGPLQFAPSNLIPSVVGYLPLDAVGVTEPNGMPLEGELRGPCGALCRGACGPDCPSANCVITNTTECSTDGGVDQAVQNFNCGVSNGCVDHDNCYDTCHAVQGCGTWSAAFCRRGCDQEAVSAHGISNTQSWARGGGPFMRRVDFAYKTPSPGACTCVAPGTEVTLEDGTTRPIETLSEGQGILAFDPATGAITRARIELVLVHRNGDYAFDQLRSASGEELELTPNHPVFTARGFLPAEELVVGDTLFIIDQVALQTRQERLIAITRRHSTSNVTYNLKTTAGNYFAADILVHNKCVAGASIIETLRGAVKVSELVPGDLVQGVQGGAPLWTPVLAVYRKSTVLPWLPGRQVNAHLAITDNHVLSLEGGPAGESDLPAAKIEGDVFDLETGTGNFMANGVLLEAANSRLDCAE